MSVRHLILGVLHATPQTGYQLSKFFDEVVSEFWTTEQRQVYYNLQVLQQKGLVEAEIEPKRDSADRKIFRVTAEGADELLSWLTTKGHATPMALPWLVQLFLGDEMPLPDLVAVLQARRETLFDNLGRLDQHLQTVRERQASAPTVRSLYRSLTIDYGVRWQRMQLDWLDDVLGHLRGVTEGSTDEELRVVRERIARLTQEALLATETPRLPTDEG
ncbi:MAG: PadR family transcriptional regulator [Acidobacteriota bacterium]